jgi:FKBP-type peptidyl-prolyl cis-trans isomerase (trigger factor)
MKSEVKKVDNNKRELHVEVSGEVVKNKFDEVFTRITKEAKVPGFRPGNAPREMIEKNYAQAAHEQVLKELVPEIYNQAIEKEELDVIELPEISEVKLDKESLSFKAKVEVTPEINLKSYKGIKVQYKKISVAPDEIKRHLDSVKESRKIDTLDDSFAKGLGYPNLKELEGAIERQIFIHKENQERQKLENDCIDSLMKGLDFVAPQSLVTRQVEDLVRQAKYDLAVKGVPRDKIEAEDKKLREEVKADAEKQVRVYLVLADIAKKEKIAIDDHMPRKVIEFLLKEADWKEAA